MWTGPGRAEENSAKARSSSALQLGAVLDARREQRHLLHHAALVRQLVQMAKTLAQRVPRIDAGDDEHGNGIGARLAHGGDRVGEARSGDDEGDARLSRHARIAVGHEAGALLVARRDVADLRPRQPAIELDRVDARNAEDDLDAVSLQKRDEAFADCGHESGTFEHV